MLVQFLDRLNRMLNQRRFQCSKGCGVCEGSEDEDGFHFFPTLDGVINITCYQCMNHFCIDCYENGEINFCHCCEKVYCFDCNEVDECYACHSVTSCKGCDDVNVW